MKFERTPSNPNATFVHVGPMHIVAHHTGEWSIWIKNQRFDGKARTRHEAEREAVAKARETVDGWARELETLAEDLR